MRGTIAKKSEINKDGVTIWEIKVTNRNETGGYNRVRELFEGTLDGAKLKLADIDKRMRDTT